MIDTSYYMAMWIGIGMGISIDIGISIGKFCSSILGIKSTGKSGIGHLYVGLRMCVAFNS